MGNLSNEKFVKPNEKNPPLSIERWATVGKYIQKKESAVSCPSSSDTIQV